MFQEPSNLELYGNEIPNPSDLSIPNLAYISSHLWSDRLKIEQLLKPCSPEVVFNPSTWALGPLLPLRCLFSWFEKRLMSTAPGFLSFFFFFFLIFSSPLPSHGELFLASK